MICVKRNLPKSEVIVAKKEKKRKRFRCRRKTEKKMFNITIVLTMEYCGLNGSLSASGRLFSQ